MGRPAPTRVTCRRIASLRWTPASSSCVSWQPCCVEACVFADLYLAQCIALIVFFALRCVGWVGGGGAGCVCVCVGGGCMFMCGLCVWVGFLLLCIWIFVAYACQIVCKLLGPLWLRHAKWALFLFFVSLLLSVVVKGAWTLETLNFEIMWRKSCMLVLRLNFTLVIRGLCARSFCFMPKSSCALCPSTIQALCANFQALGLSPRSTLTEVTPVKPGKLRSFKRWVVSDWNCAFKYWFSVSQIRFLTQTMQGWSVLCA